MKHVLVTGATGFIGKKGQGSAEVHNVLDDVDIITSTFGKALGGASGGFTSASKEIIEILRQRSRPYLFSNALSPSIVSASLKALEKLGKKKGYNLIGVDTNGVNAFFIRKDLSKNTNIKSKKIKHIFLDNKREYRNRNRYIFEKKRLLEQKLIKV